MKVIHTGEHGDYRWLTSTEDYSGTLLRLSPEIFLGRYLAIPSIDSGEPRELYAPDWQIQGRIAYSPIMTSTESIVHQLDGPDVPGFDEWYVFDTPRDLGETIQGNLFNEPLAPGRLMVFVNFPVFNLHETGPQSLSEMFWEQMKWVRPESYVADGQDHLTFVSRNIALFQRVLKTFENQL